MFCANCGAELLDWSTYCSRCGAPVAGPKTPQSDAELERLAAQGNRDAFAELYNRHSSRVYDFLLRMVGDPDEASDLMQETFLRAMRAVSTEEKGAAFLTWALTIARNLALKRRKVGGKARSRSPSRVTSILSPAGTAGPDLRKETRHALLAVRDGTAGR